MTRAELSPFGAISAVRRVFIAAGLTAPLAPDIHHVLFCVPRAEFPHPATLDAVGRVLPAPGVTATPGDHDLLIASEKLDTSLIQMRVARLPPAQQSIDERPGQTPATLVRSRELAAVFCSALLFHVWLPLCVYFVLLALFACPCVRARNSRTYDFLPSKANFLG